MRSKLINLLFACLLSSTSLLGQSFFGLSYTASLPMGETQDFIDKMSWRGIGVEYRWFVQDQFSTGLYFGWNVFHDKFSGDFFVDDAAFSGTQMRTVNALPILLTGHYYFSGSGGDFRPYVGVGFGTYRTRQRTTLGIFQVDNDNWQLGISPSIGATLPISYNVLANIEVRYNYAPKGGDSLVHSYLGISLGLAWEDY
jgi:opacity protein-like surface antigen